MPSSTVRSVVDRASAERLLQPRDDVVGERAVAAEPGVTARFALEHGPFARYERTVTLTPANGQPGPDGDGEAAPCGTSPTDGHGDGHGDGPTDGDGHGDEAAPVGPTAVVQHITFALPAARGRS